MISWYHPAAETGWWRRVRVPLVSAILYMVAAKHKVIPAIRRLCRAGMAQTLMKGRRGLKTAIVVFLVIDRNTLENYFDHGLH